MRPPETKFATIGNDRIAYQVLGDGPIDLLFLPATVDCIESRWEWPPYARALHRLASFSRVIMFDKRGAGISDTLAFEELSPWEEWAEDARAVLDAVGSKHASILGAADGGPIAMMFAATEPERTDALVLLSTSARWRADEEYPGLSTQETNHLIRQFWGTEALAGTLLPHLAHDEAFRRWVAKMTRAALRPRDVGRYLRAVQGIDVRHVLSSILVPTLVLSRKGSRSVHPEHGRYIAERIPGATFAMMPGGDEFIFTEGSDEILDRIEEFLTGTRHHADTNRVLATILFTDIVGSTNKAAALGDARWKELLESHDATARTVLDTFRGRWIRSTGDGLEATFDGPGRAIRCCVALREEIRSLGLEIRAGLHTGEVELRDGGDVGGIALHIGARVMAEAGPGEILVSASVPPLVAGSGLEFEDRGVRALKGLPGEWALFAVRA